MNARYARMQKQRLAAAERFATGARTVDVAREFGVTWRTAYKWKQTFLASGRDGLLSRRSPGRSRLLDDGQRRRLRSLLRHGATRHGFEDDSWTLARVRTLVERVFGITCSRVSIWRLLRSSSATAHLTSRKPAPMRDGGGGATGVPM